MINVGNPRYRPDVVILCGQSNSMGFGQLSPEPWPHRERYDRSALWTDGYDVSTNTWGDLRPYYGFRAGLHLSLGARMRDRGWNPALAQYSVAGTHSSYWDTNKATIASFLSTAIGQLVQPNVRAIVWYQGEHDAIDGPGNTWQTNVAATVLAIRTAISKPTLPLIVVKIPGNYAYVMNYLTATRASQDAMVAADGHATMVETPSPTYIDSLHLDYDSIDRTARLVINAIV